MQKQIPSKSNIPYFALAFALAFGLGLLGMVRHNLQTFGSLYLQSDDGDLYLSIAQNFLQNGHFIQTARPIEAFVVPPGLPVMCTLLLAITKSVSGIVWFQYGVYGLAAGFLSMSVLCVCRKNVLSALACGVFTPSLYLYCSFQIRHPNPGFILTENYVCFLLALALFLLLARRSLLGLCGELFVLTLFRPACAGLFIACLLICVLRAFRGPRQGEKAKKGTQAVYRQKASKTKLFVLCLAIAIVLSINTAINYFETGHPVVLECYGSLDLYLANNESTPGAEWYHSGKLMDFASPRYKEIYLDESLTRYEQNALAKEAAGAYVKSHLGTVLRNAAVKYDRLFRQTWGLLWYACLAGGLLLLLRKALQPGIRGGLLFAFVWLSVPPAFGLLVARYSAPMVPFMIFCALGAVFNLLFGRAENPGTATRARANSGGPVAKGR